MTIKETLKKLSVKLLGEIKRNTTTPTIKGATFTFNDGKEAAMKVTKISGDSYQDTTTLIGVSDVSDNLELEDTTDKDFKIRYFGKSSQEDFLVGVKEGEGSVTCNDSKSGDFAKLSIAGKSTQENYKIGVASGTSVHVEDADEGQMACVDLVKNLLKPTRDTSTKNGVTCTNNGDGTYTLNGTASSNCAFIVAPISTELVNYLPAKGSIKFVGFPKSGINGSCSLAIQFKTDGDGKPFDDTGDGVEITYNTVEYYNGYNCFINVYSGCVFNNAIFKPMLTTDLNATYDTYVPYEGYEITACGKNICDGIFEVGSFDNSGNPVTSNTRLRTKNFQPVRKNENISISATNGFLILEIFVYDKDKNFIKKQLISTFKVSDDGFIKFSIKNSNNTTVNVGDSVGQIEYSDAPTDYEPYVSNTFTVTPDTTYAKLQSYSPITNVFNNYGTDMTVQYKKLAAAESADTDLTAPIPSMPSEIQSVGRKGRNLLEVTAQSQTINGVTFTVNDDGTVTVNGTNSSSTVSAIFDMRTEEIEIQEDCILSSNANSKVSFYFLLNGNTDYSIMDGGSKTFKKGDKIKQFRIFVPKSATATNFVFKPMLELGTVAHDYEPYVGDGKIVEVESCGKNLYNSSQFLYNPALKPKYDYTNTNIGYNTVTTNTQYFSLGGYFKAGTYRITCLSDSKYLSFNRKAIAGSPCVTISDHLRNSYQWTQSVDGYTYFSFEVDKADNDYTDMPLGTTNIDDFKLMITRGEEIPTTYEPYQGTTTYLPLTEPLCSIGDVKDKLIVRGDGSGQLIQKLRKYVFTGNDNGSFMRANEGFYLVITQDSDGYYATGNKSINSHGLQYYFSNHDYGAYSAICIDLETCTTLGITDKQSGINWFKQQYNNGTPFTIIYDLTTPIITDLTPAQVAEFEKLQSYSGTTNVICSDSLSPTIHAEYFKTYGAEQESTDITYPTPYAPREIYNVGDKIKGYNLLEITAESQTINGVTFTVDKAKGTVTANGTASDNTYLFTRGIDYNGCINNLSSGSYIYSGCPKGGSVDTYSITCMIHFIKEDINIWHNDIGDGLPFSTTDNNTVAYIGVHIASGQTVSNLVFRPMLTEGTVQRPFEPFKCAESIAALDNKIEGEVVGKNLFDMAKINGTINGNRVTVTGTWYQKVSMNVPKNTDMTYSFNLISSDNTYLIITDKNDSNRIVEASTNIGKNEFTFNTRNNDVVNFYIYISGDSSGTSVFENLQLEEGTEATSYQPYIGTSYSLPLTETLKAIPVSDDATDFTYQDVDGKKWIADEIVKYPDGTGKLIRRIKEIDMKDVVYLYKEPYFNTGLPNMITHKKDTDAPNIYCTKLISTSNTASGIVSIDNSFTVATVNQRVYIRATSYKDTSTFLDSMGNAKWCYILATPVITDLTSDQLSQLSSLHLDNTITTVSNTADSPMEVSYYKLDGAVADENDLTVPTPDFPSEIKSVGDDEFEVVSCGKNLLDGDIFADNIVKVAKGTKDIINKTIKYACNNINNKVLFESNFKENTQYTIILKGVNSVDTTTSANMVIRYTDNTYSHIITSRISSGVKTIKTLSEPNKTIKDILGSWYEGSTTLYYDECGIFEGDISLEEFEPYTETRTTISRTLRKVGDVCDTIERDADGWKFVQRIGHIDSYNTEEITTDYMSNMGGLVSGAIVNYVLTTPIETRLSDSEALELLKLKSFDGTTNVYTTDDLEPELEVDYANNDVMATAMSNECNIMKIKTSLPKIVSANIVDENGNRIFNVNIKNPIL